MFTFHHLEKRISAARAAPYLIAASGDRGRALALYEWHTAFSGDLFAVVADIEVVLRNALHDALSRYHARVRPGGDYRWFDDPPWVRDRAGWLTPKARLHIREAKRRVQDSGRSPRPSAGRVVAELPFGFWKYLLTRHYEHTLWAPALRHAFPYAPQGLSARAGREQVFTPVDQIHALRNRLAHHEPVHKLIAVPRHPPTFVDASTVIDEAVELVSWIDPCAAVWIAGRSRVADDLAVRP